MLLQLDYTSPEKFEKEQKNGGVIKFNKVSIESQNNKNTGNKTYKFGEETFLIYAFNEKKLNIIKQLHKDFLKNHRHQITIQFNGNNNKIIHSITYIEQQLSRNDTSLSVSPNLQTIQEERSSPIYIKTNEQYLSGINRNLYGKENLEFFDNKLTQSIVLYLSKDDIQKIKDVSIYTKWIES